MPNLQLIYTIDDSLSVDDNLTALRNAVDTLDADLASVLAPQLAALAAGEAADTNALWDALYAATAPAPDGGPT